MEFTDYMRFIHVSRYARWVDALGRRETWEETVDRYFGFMEDNLKRKNNYTLDPSLKFQLRSAVLNLEIMPSMRALMTAGPALERDNIAGYNCSYVPVNSVRSFDEILYILMCGTGVGFSVECQFVNDLPIVNEHFETSDTTIIVNDSKSGWARALRELIAMLYAGHIPSWDVSKVRPAGARLKTFGGRASGPGPLEDLFRFAIRMFQNAAGRKLTSIECHDLVCKIADIVVVGGVRRSALISLSNLTDDRMRHAKSGAWWEDNVQRALANNSVCYTEKPEMSSFMEEWLSLYQSKSGERGIFNRDSAQKHVASNGRRDPEWDFGTNPCSEIILRPYQFCNLTEVVVRADDTTKSLKEKVRLATILGTLQATLTDFKYLRKIWRENTEEERLLGVSLTGIMDNSVMNGRAGQDELKKVLNALRSTAVETNKEYAQAIGIPQSTAITCVKPSGTVSQLVDSASGIHTRHAEYYIRRVRGDKKDPLTQFMIDSGIPCEEDVTNPENIAVFSFPVKSPEGAVLRDDLSALEQLELWKTYQLEYTEHKPSITVSVRENEWMGVGSWVWDNFDYVSGVSFLPHSDHTYRQAPYEDIDKATYDQMLSEMPDAINWSRLAEYEAEDNTEGVQTLACSSGACEVVDVGVSKEKVL
jgi:ribonucleoside-diphosphate reductase alpha chain